MIRRQTSPVLHLRKELSAPPVAKSAAGAAIRTIEVRNDVPAWLVLRSRAVAGLNPLPRTWTAADFHSEMLAKPWWRADRCWIAEATNLPRDAPTIVGSVTLAERVGKDGGVPVVHWLLVDPNYRRRGIGRLLMNCLERAAWDAGHRELQLETHAGWSAAVALYNSTGFVPQR